MNYVRALSVGGAISLGVLSLNTQCWMLLSSVQAAEIPAWAAEAKMNPDYKPGGSVDPAAKEEAPAAAPESSANTEVPPAPGKKPAWAEDAKMNPDYKAAESQSSHEAAPAAATAAEPAATSGSSNSGTKPAWAEDAKMNPNYKPGETTAAPPASQTAVATPAAAPASNDARSAVDPSVAYCTKTLAAEDITGKILFGLGSAEIATSSHPSLKNVASILNDCGDVTIEIGGYTDNVGSSDHNKALSERRAKAVADFLASAGVDPTKLKAVGHGDENPVSSNDTPEGRKMNRRIEFKISVK